MRGEGCSDFLIGPGMDCAVIPLRRFPNYSLVETVDFFYPLIDDAFAMGKIAFANVVSDLYAVGVNNIDKVHALISMPTDIPEDRRDIAVKNIIKGFCQNAEAAGCRVQITNVLINPWCIIGGIASSVCAKKEIIFPHNAQAGDVLVLTKPLGTQMAANMFLWMQDKNNKYRQIARRYTQDDVKESFDIALKSMSCLNKHAATLMHKYRAHCATDITGYGLLGHTKNLATIQKSILKFKITELPIIKNILDFSKALGLESKLINGTSVETSGGLLISMTSSSAEEFCKELNVISKGDQKAFIVGTVLASNQKCVEIIDDPNFIEVCL